MSLEHILLGMLRKPASGYDLRHEFEHSASHFWSAGLNQIYPTLQRMEEKKWLSSSEQPSPKGPPRRVYKRTASGTRELKNWLAAEPQIAVQRLAYVAQLVFMGQLDDLGKTQEFVTKLRDELAEQLEKFEVPSSPDVPASALQQFKEAFEKDPAGMPLIEFHYLLTIEMGRQYLESKVAMCDSILEMIEQKIKASNGA